MSNRYKGGVISATPPTTSGGESGTASGAWTLEQQMQLQAAGLWPSPPPPLYIENVFSTYLYTGNGSTQTITNGINLSGKGGLVWIKWRNTTYGSVDHNLYDTSRGVLNRLYSNLADAQTTQANSLTAFNSDGFSLGGTSGTNGNNANYASWTFRKQPKFFDVLTYTGNQAVGHNIPHNLGSAPGLIIVKAYEGDSRNWFIYHRSLGATKHLVFTTAAATVQTDIWNDTEPTSTQFTVGDSSNVNQNGRLYIAYLFAHDAGGFGLTGTDNVISCGSLVSGTVQDINLGYEPQWIMYKNASGSTGGWTMFDTMRGMTTDGSGAYLQANTSAAEATASAQPSPLATGFRWNYTGNSGQTFIYIAIRRGPMKVPTSGTSVYETGTQLSTSPSFVSGFPVDFAMRKYTGISDGWNQVTRLQGTATLGSDSTAAETTGVTPFTFDYQTGWSTINSADSGIRSWMMRRAPSFMDVVCYTGTEVSGQTFNHNLGAVPEMMIVKSRSGTTDWTVYHSALGASARIYLNATNAANTGTAAPWNSTAPTSTVFSLGNAGATNLSGATFVNYLFATCAGVSKVGSYTGTGALQTINCGFAAGARFVLIKITNTTGNWFVWDTARGMVVGTDPSLALNSTAAEEPGDSVYTVATGFQLAASPTYPVNSNGYNYIFLAIA